MHSSSRKRLTHQIRGAGGGAKGGAGGSHDTRVRIMPHESHFTSSSEYSSDDSEYDVMDSEYPPRVYAIGPRTQVHKHFYSVLNVGDLEGLETTDEFFKAGTIRNGIKMACGCLAFFLICTFCLYLTILIIIVVNKK
jgi:hypothetical protein